eukprot:TRINITY_DN7196_c1_g3_i4.p1 TRINITY_DN7196_c1_g3~~TRINITY_DN7196_c1_g3_i4.p1  ORF type:complete len:287 (-),score=38.89 TRINITY_DN7196_c1_g3_i4:159-1019(-)
MDVIALRVVCGINWCNHPDLNTQLFSKYCNVQHAFPDTTYQALPLVEQYLEYVQPTIVTQQEYKPVWSRDSSSGDSIGTGSGSSDESKIFSSGDQRIVSAAEIGLLSDSDGSMNPQLVTPPPAVDLCMEDLIQIVTSSPHPSNSFNKRKLPSHHRLKVVNRRGMCRQTVCQLAGWLCENILNPYPTRLEKVELSNKLNVKENQVSNWFVNARTRFWKPIVHEVYMQHKQRLMANAANDRAVLEQLLQCDQTTNAPVLLSLMDTKAKQHLKHKVTSTFTSAGFLTLL